MKTSFLSLAFAAILAFVPACGGDVQDFDPNVASDGGFSCPTGQKFENNKCVDKSDSGSSCPAGQHIVNAKCVDDTTPSGSIVVHITGLQSVEQFKYEVTSDPSALGRTFTGGGSNIRSGNEITISIPYTGSTPYLRFSCWTGSAWCASNYGSPTLNISGNATFNGVTKNFTAIRVRPNNAEVLVKFGDGNVPDPLTTN